MTVDLFAGELQIPIVVIRGECPGPVVCLLGGIHGAEYTSMDAVIRLSQDLKPDQLHGSVILILMANPPAFYARSVYVTPLDGKNLNRVFPGNPKGSVSELLAHTITEEALKRSDYLIDFHGGDLVEALIPFSLFVQVGDPAIDQASEDLARSFGIDLVCRSVTQGSTYAAAAAMGIPAILVEAGGQGILDLNESQRLYDGAQNAMQTLGMLSGTPKEPVRSPLHEMVWVRSDHRGLFYSDRQVGEWVEAGDPVGDIRDEFGDSLVQVQAPATGPILFFVTSLATNPGDPLMAIAQLVESE